MENIMKHCPRCKEETPQRIDKYNLNDYESLKVYVCEICHDANDSITD